MSERVVLPARFKRQAGQRWGGLVHDGLWFPPSKHAPDGGRVVAAGRRGEGSPHDFTLAGHDEGDEFDQTLARGSVRLRGLPGKIAAKRDQDR